VALIDGRVRCWGADQEGQLGTGVIAERGGVHDVLGIRDVVGVAAGGLHTCVRGGSGALSCWGSDIFGQLGSGRRTSRDWPAPVAR
jgi:alpha-tubulin suppressor-like RCC1 family protein